MSERLCDVPLSLNLHELAAAIKNRAWTATEITEKAIERIKLIDKNINAFCTVDVDYAMQQAEKIDATIKCGKSIGPLDGVPVAVKDLICTKNLRTTFGSALYADFVPDRDDIVVERLKSAGAIIIGKTNTSEFGYGGGGP